MSSFFSSMSQWTLLSVNSRAQVEAFYMKCQGQLLQIKWHQFIRNVEISATTGLLPSITETISGRRNGLFSHVARLADDVPAHKALSSQINLSLGRPPDNQWSRPVPRVVLVTDGLTRSGEITTSHLPTSGGELSIVVTAEQRYGPCWPRVNIPASAKCTTDLNIHHAA